MENTIKYDPEVILNACQCGHNGCVEERCPFSDEGCPAYICKNDLLNTVYELYKAGRIKVF